jgi:DNA-binding transcriptional LysR family regulator
MMPAVQAAVPDVVPIERRSMNVWEDDHVRTAIEATGRKRLLISGLTGRDSEHWIQPEWTLCANNAEVLRDAAIKGRGVALLPTFIAAASLRDGTLQSFLSD